MCTGRKENHRLGQRCQSDRMWQNLVRREMTNLIANPEEFRSRGGLQKVNQQYRILCMKRRDVWRQKSCARLPRAVAVKWEYEFS
jgi:hypothetical protein